MTKRDFLKTDAQKRKSIEGKRATSEGKERRYSNPDFVK